MADTVLNQWAGATPVEVQQAVVDKYVETGELDHEAAGVSADEAGIVEAAFMQRTEVSVLKPLGLGLAQWSSYLSDTDAATLRRAAVKGDFAKLRSHAEKVAAYIHQNGDVNAGNY